MSGTGRAVLGNARFELVRLRRSRRIWLLLIAPVAGPIGSVIADRYLGVPSVALELALGLLVAGGLAAMVLLDLVALAAGEEISRDAHRLFFTLPEPRAAQLAGRLSVAAAAPILAFAGAAGILEITVGLGGAGASGSTGALFDPFHLFLATLALLLFLAGVTATAAVIGRGPAPGLVAGILAGVLVAGMVTYLLLERSLHLEVAALLASGGVAALGVAMDRYHRLSEG